MLAAGESQTLRVLLNWVQVATVSGEPADSPTLEPDITPTLKAAPREELARIQAPQQNQQEKQPLATAVVNSASAYRPLLYFCSGRHGFGSWTEWAYSNQESACKKVRAKFKEWQRSIVLIEMGSYDPRATLTVKATCAGGLGSKTTSGVGSNAFRRAIDTRLSDACVYKIISAKSP